MPRPLYFPNPNLGEEMAEAADFAGNMARCAEPARDMVENLSPQGSGTGAGSFARSIVIQITGDEVLLGSTDPFAHIVEWGSVNNPAYAPLRRGVEAGGMRLELGEQDDYAEYIQGYGIDPNA